MTVICSTASSLSLLQELSCQHHIQPVRWCWSGQHSTEYSKNLNTPDPQIPSKNSPCVCTMWRSDCSWKRRTARLLSHLSPVHWARGMSTAKLCAPETLHISVLKQPKPIVTAVQYKVNATRTRWTQLLQCRKWGEIDSLSHILFWQSWVYLSQAFRWECKPKNHTCLNEIFATNGWEMSLINCVSGIAIRFTSEQGPLSVSRGKALQCRREPSYPGSVIGRLSSSVVRVSGTTTTMSSIAPTWHHQTAPLSDLRPKNRRAPGKLGDQRTVDTKYESSKEISSLGQFHWSCWGTGFFFFGHTQQYTHTKFSNWSLWCQRFHWLGQNIIRYSHMKTYLQSSVLLSLNSFGWLFFPRVDCRNSYQ